MNSTLSSSPGLRAFRPIIFVFLLFNAGIYASRSLLIKWNVSPDVLLIGNIILFIAVAISFYFYFKSFQGKQPYAFIQMIYTGMFIKMLLCLFAVFIYVMVAGKGVNKRGIFGCMGLYMLYTMMEVVILMKVSKQKKNA